MDNLFCKLDKKIIQREFLLTRNYTPEIIKRKQKIKEIAENFNSITREYPFIDNIIIYGSSGTGKTLITNHVLHEFSKYLDDEDIPYKLIKVQASRDNTKYSIFKSIVKQLYGKEIGKDTSDLHDAIIQKLADEKKVYVLFLDEIHNISRKSELNSIIYSISRLGEDIAKAKSRSLPEKNKLKHSLFAYVFISNDNKILDYLRTDTQSSFEATNIWFGKYKPEEIYAILRDRINKGAIYKGSISDGDLKYISAITTKEGDARYAIKLLKVSARLAERKNNDKINIQNIEESNDYLRKNYLKEVLRELSALESLVLKSIYYFASNNNTPTTKKVYNEICEKEKNTISLSRISQIVSKFIEQGIIQATSSFKSGHTRRLSISETEDVIKEYLANNEYVSV